MKNTNQPQVGVGVFIFKGNEFLLGKRQGSHGDGEWSLPGGHLEFFEEWEECCKREVREETGLQISDLRFINATNDLFPKERLHYVTLFFASRWNGGEVENREPDKCSEWRWVKQTLDGELPVSPLFPPLKQLIKTMFPLEPMSASDFIKFHQHYE